MNILFSPPLGDTARLHPSSFLPHAQAIPLLFTARLSTSDYDQLVAAGGRVQVWSDLPSHGPSDGQWRDLDFCEIETLPCRSDEHHVISLGSTLPAGSAREKTLYLFISLQADVLRSRKYSFTYRIAYSSGRIAWLGGYGQNGSLVLDEAGQSDIRLKGGWTSDPTNGFRLRIQDAVDEESVSVANLSDYSVLSLDNDRFTSHHRDSSLVFLIPKPSHRTIVLRPTYILASSNGVSITVSSEGTLLFTGTGTAIVLHSDYEADPQGPVLEALSHSGLEHWKILPCATDSKAIVLNSTSPRRPVDAAIVPLWPTIHLDASVVIDFSDLIGAARLGSTVNDFALFSPYNLQIHAFSQECERLSKVFLNFDKAGSRFVLSPVYRLRNTDTVPGIKRTWAAALLSPYIVVPSPYTAAHLLPTPPPSPHVQPIVHLHRPYASIDSVISSVEKLPTNNALALENVPVSKETVHTKKGGMGKSAGLKKPRTRVQSNKGFTSQPIRSVMWLLFRAFWAPMTFFLRLFFGVIWPRIPIIPRIVGRVLALRNQHERQTRPVIEEKASNGAYSEVGSPEMTLVASLSHQSGGLETVPSESSIAQIVDNAGSEALLFADLQRDSSDLSATKTTGRIALFPLQLSPIEEDDAEVQVEEAVRFFNTETSFSVTTPVLPSISKCNMTLHGLEENVEKRYSYLLEYQLDWERGQKSKTVGISSPAEII